MKITGKVVAVAMVLGVGFTAIGSASATTSDASPPSITWNPARVLVGARLSDAGPAPSVSTRISWAQSDPSGICAESGQMGGADLGLGLDETSFTHPLAVSLDDEVVYTVSDCAIPANTIGVNMPFSLTLAQESAATLSAGWSTSRCTCWSGGAVIRSSQVGAKATWAFNSWKPAIALVSNQAPNRGTADIYIDGIKVGSINGASPTTVNMVVAWSRVFANGNFAHTLDVVVTKGRVDIDAFLSASCALAECQ